MPQGLTGPRPRLSASRFDFAQTGDLTPAEATAAEVEADRLRTPVASVARTATGSTRRPGSHGTAPKGAKPQRRTSSGGSATLGLSRRGCAPTSHRGGSQRRPPASRAKATKARPTRGRGTGHFEVTITDTTLTITRRTTQIQAEAALDGIYVIRTTVPEHTLDAAGVVGAYKNLAHVERDFRTIKVDDLDLRPIYHRLEHRVRAHVLIVMLAAYLTWHLRRTLAPLTFTDEERPTRTDPVAPAARSDAATRKASRRKDLDDQPVRSFRALLDHLATLTRNDIRYGGEHGPLVPTLAIPTPTQRRVFELLGTVIPLTLK